MPFNSIGDLASSMMLSQASSRAKRSLMQFSQELTTGVTSDIRGVLRNDLSKQMDWEHSLASNRVLDKTLTEALSKTQAKQTVLAAINDATMSFANDIDKTVASGSIAATNTLSRQAESILDQVLSQFNTQAVGQSLFAGSATNSASMAPFSDIITSVKASLGATSTVSDVVLGVQAWMADPIDGFAADAYIGTLEDTSPIRLSLNRTIEEPIRADHSALQSIVESMILATLSADDTFAPSPESQAGLLQAASSGLRSGEPQLIELRASLGYVESEITREKVLIGAEISAVEQIRAKTIGINEFEVASRLQDTELQLEKIYAVTARSSRMSLLEYLR